MKRHPVNKKASAKKFHKHNVKTKGANMNGAPMRGGIRL